jgi:peptide/nickel transport system permease protein
VKLLATRGAKVAAGTLLAFVLLALVAALLAPDPNAITDPVAGRLLAPGLAHPLGLTAALCSAVLGALVGMCAGLFGGAIDTLLMRGVDVLTTVPRAFVLLFAAAAWETMPPWAFTLLIGLTGWYVVARIVRAETVRLMTTEALVAARALGADPVRIIFRHLLPNVTGQLAVATALGVGEVMLLEAGLSFLGAGLRPPTPSWGVMIHDGKDVLLTAPWVTLAPGLALTIVVLAVNRLGDAVRDAADPRSR